MRFYHPRIGLRWMLVFCAVAPIGLAWCLTPYFAADNNAPSDAQVVAAVKASGKAMPPVPYRISKQRIASYVDSSHVDAKLGAVYLFHEHFKCEVFASKAVEPSVVVYFDQTKLIPAAPNP